MLTGIDTSHHSGFSQAQLNDITKKNNLYFNFIKASEGLSFKDEKFTDLWQMSRQSGLMCGAYHFFRPLAAAAAQATNFINQYKKVSRAGVLPPVVDIEWAPVKVSGEKVEQWNQLPAGQRVSRIKTFLSAVEAELHIKPVIYTAASFWKEFIEGQSADADNAFFSEFLLWCVDLKGSGKVPKPWLQKPAAFIQTHLGELATTQELFDKLDQDKFAAGLKELLNITVPGFTIMRNFPKSNIVKTIQEKLISLGATEVTADGDFGSLTENAVKKFQSDNGLFDNGIVDAQTWNKLL